MELENIIQAILTNITGKIDEVQNSLEEKILEINQKVDENAENISIKVEDVQTGIETKLSKMDTENAERFSNVSCISQLSPSCHRFWPHS